MVVQACIPALRGFSCVESFRPVGTCDPVLNVGQRRRVLMVFTTARHSNWLQKLRGPGVTMTSLLSFFCVQPLMVSWILFSLWHWDDLLQRQALCLFSNKSHTGSDRFCYTSLPRKDGRWGGDECFDWPGLSHMLPSRNEGMWASSARAQKVECLKE